MEKINEAKAVTIPQTCQAPLDPSSSEACVGVTATYASIPFQSDIDIIVCLRVCVCVCVCV